jgi:hypothetical protein
MVKITGRLVLPVLYTFLVQEAKMVAALRHPNVVLFLGYCAAPPCVMTEYCSRGSVYDLFGAACRSSEVAATLPWPRCLGLVRSGHWMIPALVQAAPQCLLAMIQLNIY